MDERPSSTLTARERRALRDIEEALRSDDPALADELEFEWWRRRLVANPLFWAWVGVGACAMILGFLAGGVVIAALGGFALAVLAIDRCVAAMVGDRSTETWTALRAMFGSDADGERER